MVVQKKTDHLSTIFDFTIHVHVFIDTVTYLNLRAITVKKFSVKNKSLLNSLILCNGYKTIFFIWDNFILQFTVSKLDCRLRLIFVTKCKYG